MHRAMMVSTPMTDRALLIHDTNTHGSDMRMDAARVFYRWRDVWRNRKEGGFKCKLHEEEDWEQEPAMEWDYFQLQTAAHVAVARHVDFKMLQDDRKKATKAVELFQRQEDLEDKKIAGLMEKDPAAAAEAIAVRDKAKQEATEKAQAEAEEAEPPRMYAGKTASMKFAIKANLCNPDGTPFAADVAAEAAAAAAKSRPKSGSSSGSRPSSSDSALERLGSVAESNAMDHGLMGVVAAVIPEHKPPPPPIRKQTAHHEVSKNHEFCIKNKELLY